MTMTRYRTTASLASEPGFKYFGRRLAKNTVVAVPKKLARKYVIRGRLQAIPGTIGGDDLVLTPGRRWLDRATKRLDVASAVAQHAATGTVTTIAPATGDIAGGEAITLTGTNLITTSAITFGGVAATSIVVVSDETVTCVAPAHAAGAVNVVITTEAGTITKTAAYTYAESGA